MKNRTSIKRLFIVLAPAGWITNHYDKSRCNESRDDGREGQKADIKIF